jgi:hypothetical protein
VEQPLVEALALAEGEEREAIVVIRDEKQPGVDGLAVDRRRERVAPQERELERT